MYHYLLIYKIITEVNDLELFDGFLSFNLKTVVEGQDDVRAMQNVAHEGLSHEFINELAAFIASRGYRVYAWGANLNHAGTANLAEIKAVEEDQKKGQSKVDEYTGKVITTRFVF